MELQPLAPDEARVALERNRGVPRDPFPAPEVPEPDDQAATSSEVSPEEHRALAIPRPASVSSEPIVHAWGGPEPANDLQLGLLRAGIERGDTPDG